MTRITINDRVTYKITRREYTDEGFLKVPGRVARTGIQKYLASELGLTDRNPNEIVNVYRPAEEVFNPDSLNTYNGVDVTDDHPSSLVDSKTFKDSTRGVVISVGRQDGDFVECDIIIKDAEAVAKAESGKVQLSAGYTAYYDHSPGVTPDGEQYEFIQRDIVINHVALVDRARAGIQARLYDHTTNHNQGGANMRVIQLDSGKQVQIEDDAAATLIEDTFERLKQKAKDAEAEKEKAEAEKDKMEAEKDAAEEEAKKAKESSNDAAIIARLKDVSDTMGQARQIAGDEFTCDSVDVITMKREALLKANDSLSLDGKSEAYIEAAFDMAVRHAESSSKTNDEQIRNLSKDGANSQQPTNDGKKEPSARQKALDSKAAAWKKTAGV